MNCPICKIHLEAHEANGCLDDWISIERGEDDFESPTRNERYSTDINIAWKLVPEILKYFDGRDGIGSADFALGLMYSKEPALFICKTFLRDKLDT